MGVDGTFIAPLAGMPTGAVRVAPSPDGRTLAFLRATDDLLHLWLIDRDGSNPRPLLAGERVVESMAWSPDGRRIAFGNSTLDASADIWVMNADGTGLSQVAWPEVVVTEAGGSVAVLHNRRSGPASGG
jgi:dipeptidyl aminopeptidase/acylaminoacyl peptidase